MSELENKYYNVRIKLRNDSWTNWKEKENSFRPYNGEIIIYNILEKDEAESLKMEPIPYQTIKIGNGVDVLKQLPFINDINFNSYKKEEIDNKFNNLAKVSHSGDITDLKQNEQQFFILDCN